MSKTVIRKIFWNFQTKNLWKASKSLKASKPLNSVKKWKSLKNSNQSLGIFLNIPDETCIFFETRQKIQNLSKNGRRDFSKNCLLRFSENFIFCDRIWFCCHNSNVSKSSEQLQKIQIRIKKSKYLNNRNTSSKNLTFFGTLQNIRRLKFSKNIYIELLQLLLWRPTCSGSTFTLICFNGRHTRALLHPNVLQWPTCSGSTSPWCATMADMLGFYFTLMCYNGRHARTLLHPNVLQ